MKTENVTIRLTSIFEDMEPQVRTLQGKMTWFPDERSVRLMYIQQMEEDRAPETAVWELDEQKKPARLIINRPGADYRLIFDPRQEYETGFQSPAGKILVKVVTESLEGDLASELAGDLAEARKSLLCRVTYHLTLGGQEQGKVTVEYQIG